MQENLSCPFTITSFVCKFPEKFKEEYVKFEAENRGKGQSQSSLLNAFLVKAAEIESELRWYSEEARRTADVEEEKLATTAVKVQEAAKKA